MLKVENLEFAYPKSKKKALKGVSFEIAEGEIFGFLGPNGAGKTTTQKAINGLLRNYSGNIEILGKNLKKWKSDLYEHVGICFELPNHYQKLTALENLELFSSFYSEKIVRPQKLLKMVDLNTERNQRVGTFSKGMKMKLNFARALLNDPEVLFLDEPTTGLDPVSARRIKDIILQQKKAGKAIFLTTHNMAIADELCDRVGFLIDGKLELVQNPKELKIAHGKKTVRVEYLRGKKLMHKDFPLDNLSKNAGFMKLLKSGQVQTIHTAEATLEDIFIKVTGRQLT